MANNDLLQRTLAHIEAHPEQWDQGNYASQTDGNSCGTAYCFAGWAVALTYPAATFLFAESPDHWSTDRTARVVRLAPEFTAPAEIRNVARKILGIGEETANVLFDSGNNLENLRSMVGDLVAGLPILDDLEDES